MEKVDLIAQQTEEMKEGLAYFIDEALFSMRDPIPEPPKKSNLLKRIRGTVAKLLINITQVIDEDTYYEHYSDF